LSSQTTSEQTIKSDLNLKPSLTPKIIPINNVPKNSRGPLVHENCEFANIDPALMAENYYKKLVSPQPNLEPIYLRKPDIG
jgi:hypothetical protein